LCGATAPENNVLLKQMGAWCTIGGLITIWGAITASLLESKLGALLAVDLTDVAGAQTVRMEMDKPSTA
jgi:hypothetical protein